MKKGYAVLVILLLTLLSCRKSNDPYPFANSKRTKLVMNYPKDNNGYYRVPIDSSTNTNRFVIYAEAAKLIPFYWYNKVSVMSVRFDCNTYYILGSLSDTLVVHIPLYSPFRSLYSSPYFTTPIPVKNKTVILSQYANSIVEMVQETSIYLKEYDPGTNYKPADEYKPESGMYWSKRIVGPIPGYFKGDTIIVYSKTEWDAGNYTYEHPDETTKIDSVKIIFK